MSDAERGVSRTRCRRPVCSRERGASLVLVSGALVAFVAIAALAVDYGQLVAKRRAMVTATDAASLAAATVYANGGADGCDEALVYMNTNAPDNENFSCQYFPGDGRGIVEVASSQTIPFGFGSVIGVSSGTAASTTAAEFLTVGVAGIRPFMLCQTYDQTFFDWLNGTNPVAPQNMEFVMSDNLDACLVVNSGGGGGNGGNGGGGNWAIVDFSNSNGVPGTPDVAAWIEDGLSPDLRPDACSDDAVTCPLNPETCDVDGTACIGGSTGVLRNALDSELQSITGNGTVSLLPVVRDVTAGSGSGLEARIESYVMAELVSYETLGNANVRSMTFRFLNEEDFNGDAAVRICGATAPDCP